MNVTDDRKWKDTTEMACVRTTSPKTSVGHTIDVWQLPEFAEVSGGVRHHHIDDVLKHFGLTVETLDDSPLDQIVVPQMTLTQQTIQHVDRWSGHLDAVLPQAQWVAVTHLLVRHVYVTAA